ncbi:type VII secretion-associated serine protease mycosin [Actinomycetospora sp.]|uniref:type VII secretion-associated serine protease mycosin n=1 Tax=Actinomycetospora sp. TaxID=1872135 RepID=UPI002F430227
MVGGGRAAGVLLGTLLAVAVATAPAAVTAPAASAAVPGPPAPDPSLLAGLDPTPSPLPGAQQRVACVSPLGDASGEDAGTGLGDGAGPGASSWAQERLRITDAWRWGRGAGQTVAVIDTGVAPHPRLAGRLVDGGDFVGPGRTGTTDCDGHGTLVAGIVAAAPDPSSGPGGFVGVAPEARVLAIRQSSATVVAGGRTDPGAGDVVTLARAVLHAVDLGATVVNVSEAACLPAAVAPRVLAPLRAAIRAAVDRDVVVVAAAGNAGSGACVQSDPSGTAEDDPARRDQIVAPAWFGDDVLSVGYVGQDGRPSPRTVRGPWVSVAAPGTDVVSLSPTGPGLVDRVQAAGARTGDPAGSPIEGSSFAAPYVAGMAALVRARFPDLTAREVTARIVATAQATGPRDDAVGGGIVDPVAALSTPVVTAAGNPAGASDNGGPGRVDLAGSGDADSGARAVALIGTAGAVVLGGVVLGAVVLARRARRPR